MRSVYKCFCELSELVHRSLYVLHSPGRPLTSRDLLNIYTQYLDWYDQIPEVLRLGHNFTPAVLFAHMYYHFAILLLFRPLIKLRIIGSGVRPRDVCAQAADNIQRLLRSYSRLYTLRRTPSFVPYFVLTSSIMHLAIGASHVSPGGLGPDPNPSSVPPVISESVDAPGKEFGGAGKDSVPQTAGGGETGTGRVISGAREEGSREDSVHDSGTTDTVAEADVNVNGNERTTSPRGGRSAPAMAQTTRLDPKVAAAIRQGISDLTEMAPCHHFAHQAVNILRYLAKKWHINVDIEPSAGAGRVEGTGPTAWTSSASSAPSGGGDGGGYQQYGGRQGRDGNGDEEDENDRLVRPNTGSLNFFAPNVVEEDFVSSWKGWGSTGASASRAGGGAAMTGVEPVPGCGQPSTAIENPLFWPFPMQGRPILPQGRMLEEAGFAMLNE